MEDTIVAISTALGVGAISIIRVSGVDAIKMVNDIFDCVSEKADTYLISQVITQGCGKVLKHTWSDVFGSARLKDWGKGFKYFFCFQQGVRGRIKYFYFFWSGIDNCF